MAGAHATGAPSPASGRSMQGGVLGAAGVVLGEFKPKIIIYF